MGSELKDETDERLMERVQADSGVAFAELYDRHGEPAFRVARAVCRDLNRAEDAVQEAFLSVWRGRAIYRPESGAFKPWMMRVVQNRAIDSYRTAARPGEKVAQAHPEEAPDTAASPLDVVIGRRQSDVLHAALRRLPPAQADVIVLAYYGGLSHSEIATQLALPKGTVKGRMRLGLEKLRGGMESVADAAATEALVPASAP